MNIPTKHSLFGRYTGDPRVMRPMVETMIGPLTQYARGSWFSAFLSVVYKKKGRVYLLETDDNPHIEAVFEDAKKTCSARGPYYTPVYHDYPKLIALWMTGRTSNVHGEMVQVASGSMQLADTPHDVCMSKLLGEFLERASLILPPAGTASYPKVYTVKPGFSYRDIPHPTGDQKNAFPTIWADTDTDPMPCVYMRSHTQWFGKYIPLSSVYLRCPDTLKIYNHATTSGCGGGFTFEQAFVSGALELIERDHFLLWWYSGVHPRKIRFSPDSKVGELLRQAATYGLEVFFLDTSYDLRIASTICHIIDPVLSIQVMGGKAGCGEDIYVRAYEEAVCMLHIVRKKRETRQMHTSFFATSFLSADVAKHEREVQACTIEAIAYVRETWLQGAVVDVERVQQGIPKIEGHSSMRAYIVAECGRLAKEHGAAYDVLSYRFTNSILKRYGYIVVRVFIPAFLKLHLHEHLATPLSKRLKKFMDDHDAQYAETSIRKAPHFFP